MGDKRCYTVQDLQEILCVSRPSIYELLKKREFRWIQVGGKYRISKKSFDEWLDHLESQGRNERADTIKTIDSLNLFCEISYSIENQ